MACLYACSPRAGLRSLLEPSVPPGHHSGYFLDGGQALIFDECVDAYKKKRFARGVEYGKLRAGAADRQVWT
jgi:hypothetical protein